MVRSKIKLLKSCAIVGNEEKIIFDNFSVSIGVRIRGMGKD